MADEDINSLEEYRIQLQQVEAALIAEPNNEELLKLRDDLREVLELSTDLLAEDAKLVGNKSNNSEMLIKDFDDFIDNHDAASSAFDKPLRDWKVSDRCMARWKDGNYYEAVIDGISNQAAAVTFLGSSGHSTFQRLNQLKVPELAGSSKRLEDKRAKRNQFQYVKEKKKVKLLKRQQKLQDLEDQKEKEKNQWQKFSAKAKTKSLRGFSRNPSIFATNEESASRVGVGTCGISGRPPSQPKRQYH